MTYATSQRDWGKVGQPTDPEPPGGYTYVEHADSLFDTAEMKRERSPHRAAADFPVGTRVRIVCRMQDFMYFGDGNDPGEVIANKDRYLGIIVKFDKPHGIHRNDILCSKHPCADPAHGYLMEDFNFEPSDLIVEGEPHPWQ